MTALGCSGRAACAGRWEEDDTRRRSRARAAAAAGEETPRRRGVAMDSLGA